MLKRGANEITQDLFITAMKVLFSADSIVRKKFFLIKITGPSSDSVKKLTALYSLFVLFILFVRVRLVIT